MDQPTKSNDKAYKSSINDAISHFRSNLLQSKGFSANTFLNKRRIPTHQPGHSTQSASTRIDEKTDFSSKDFSSKDFCLDDNVAGARRPFQPPGYAADFSRRFEHSGINSLNENISQFISESQSGLTSESSFFSSRKPDKQPQDQSISDILKHFKQPSFTTSKRAETLSSELLNKLLGDFNNINEKNSFYDFIKGFKERYKLSYAKLDIQVEKLCNSITGLLMDSSINTDSEIYETKQLIDKFDISIPIKHLIQPGYMDIRLLTLALMAYTLPLNNELKPVNMKDCGVFNAKSAYLYKDSIIIYGDLLLPKPECVIIFLNDSEIITISNDDFLDKIYLKKHKVVFISRKKWYHCKSLFNETCKSINPTVDSKFISKYLERRNEIARVYNAIDDEFHKLDLSLTNSSTIHSCRRIDINFTFFMIEPILLDFIIPHTIVQI